MTTSSVVEEDVNFLHGGPFLHEIGWQLQEHYTYHVENLKNCLCSMSSEQFFTCNLLLLYALFISCI